MDKEYFTIDDMALYLSVKRSTLYAKVESGEIPFYKIGRLVRFKREDVEKWMESHRRERVDTDIKAKRILEATTRQKMNMDSVIKKSIESVKHSCYTPNYGKSDRIKGLRKEV
jgi:excisionase family DNA binding protein